MRSHLAEPPSPGFAPVRLDDVEIGAPLNSLPSVNPEAVTSVALSMCLVRLHGRPLGLIELELPPDGVPAEVLAMHIQAELGEEVAQHLREDGIPPSELRAEGIADSDQPRCVAAREELLARAPSVSVVIITRDRPARALATVRSILSSRYPSERYEVIVVETPVETESISQSIAELDGKVPVRVVHEPQPGISRARNTGLQKAGGDLVVFADDDSDVDRHWLATLISAFDRGEQVGAAAGITLPGALETPSQRWFEGFGGLQRGFETRVYSLHDPPPDQPLFPFTPGALGSGRSMAFRRQVLMRLGGFDLALGPPTPTEGGEDIEALLRVLLSGYEVVHDPAAIVWHAHLPDYPMLRRRMWGYGVGLTACLTKAVVDNPRLLPKLLRKLPRGLAFALSQRSEKNEKRQDDFPSALVRLELAGLAYGPIAYFRSRWQCRRIRPSGLAASGDP